LNPVNILQTSTTKVGGVDVGVRVEAGLDVDVGLKLALG